MFTVRGPEGGIEGIFDEEKEAMNHAMNLAVEFTAPFSIYHEGKFLVTYDRSRKATS